MMLGRGNKYLEEDSDSDYTSSDDDIDIHGIVSYGTYQDVKEAIARDRPRLIALKDKEGRIAIHYAALFDRMKIAVFLIAKKSNIDAKDKKEQTPLHLAAASGLTDMCRTLLEFHANIKLKDNKCWTALHHAVDGRYYDTSTLLVKRGSDIDAEDHKHGRTVLHIASEKGYPELVEMLIVRGASMTASGDHFYSKTPLHLACLHGHTECARILVKRGAQLNPLSGFLDQTPLHMACEKGHVDCVKILLDNGAELNMMGNHINGNTALHYCAQYDRLECLEMLIDYGANVSQLGRFTTIGSPLHTACQYGNSHAAHILISRGRTDINLRDESALTPLHIACRYEKYDVVFMLIMMEADVNCKADNGKVPFDYVTIPTIKEKMRLAAEEAAEKKARRLAAERATNEVKENLLMGREEARQRAMMKAEAEQRQKEIRLSEFVSLLRAAADVSGEAAALLSIAEEYSDQNINCKLFNTVDVMSDGAYIEEQSASSSVSSSYYTRGTAKRLPWRPGMDQSLVDDSSRIGYSIERGVIIPSYSPHEQYIDDNNMYALVPYDDVSEELTQYEYYCTALTRAAFRGFQEIVHILLNWPDVDINSVESNGNTALHNAALMGHREIVEELILSGAKNTIMNNQGKAAANIAKTDYIREMIRNPSMIRNKLQYQDDVLRHLLLRFQSDNPNNNAPTVKDFQMIESVVVPSNNYNNNPVSAAIISNYSNILTDISTQINSNNNQFSNSSILVPYNGQTAAASTNNVKSDMNLSEIDSIIEKYGRIPIEFGGSLADFFFNGSNENKSSISDHAFLDLLTLQKGYLPTSFDSTQEYCEIKDYFWLIGYNYRNNNIDYNNNNLRDRRPILYKLSKVMNIIQQIFTNTEIRTVDLFSLHSIQPLSSNNSNNSHDNDHKDNTNNETSVKLPSISNNNRDNNKHVAHLKAALSTLQSTIDPDNVTITPTTPIVINNSNNDNVENKVRQILKDAIDWKKISANVRPEDIWRLVSFAIKCDAFVEHVLQILEPDYYGWPAECYNWYNNDRSELNADNICYLSSINRIKISYLRQYSLISDEIEDCLLTVNDLGFSECFTHNNSNSNNKSQNNDTGDNYNEDNSDNNKRRRRKVPDLFVNPPRYWRVAIDAIYDVSKYVKIKTEATYPADSVRAALLTIASRSIINNKHTSLVNTHEQRQNEKLTSLQLWLKDLQLLHYELYFHHEGFRLLRDFEGLSENDCLYFFKFLKTGDMRRLCRNIAKLTNKEIIKYENKSKGIIKKKKKKINNDDNTTSTSDVIS